MPYFEKSFLTSVCCTNSHR